MADITEIKLPDATVFTVKDPNAQPKTLATPLTINGNTESTVEGALDGLNDYSDALKDNLAANENVYGAKNLNSYPYKDTTKSLNGITFTDNGNGTITVNGTASANTVFDMHLYLDNPCIVENGAYILSGCPSGGGISTYNIRAYEKNSGGTDVVIGKDYGDGVTLTLNGDYYDSNSVHLDLAIVVTAGAVISTPITFKPMLCDARVIDPTFAPFAKTNLQLTNDKAERDDLSTIHATGSTNTTGATIASGTFFYLNGSYCKAIANIAVNATFTLNTNFKVASVGEELSSINNNLTVEDISSQLTVNTLAISGATVVALKYGKLIKVSIFYGTVVATGEATLLVSGLPKCKGSIGLGSASGGDVNDTLAISQAGFAGYINTNGTEWRAHIGGGVLNKRIYSSILYLTD